MNKLQLLDLGNPSVDERSVDQVYLYSVVYDMQVVHTLLSLLYRQIQLPPWHKVHSPVEAHIKKHKVSFGI